MFHNHTNKVAAGVGAQKLLMRKVLHRCMDKSDVAENYNAKKQRKRAENSLTLMG